MMEGVRALHFYFRPMPSVKLKKLPYRQELLDAIKSFCKLSLISGAGLADCLLLTNHTNTRQRFWDRCNGYASFTELELHHIKTLLKDLQREAQFVIDTIETEG